jgi:DNA-binding LacI/PurR family transcriptional regulator
LIFAFMHRRSKITMADVARAAGVSKQTVSAVINNKSGISEKTRVRIRRIVARLDYHPNLLAGSLRAQRSVTIGVLIPSITNPFYPELVRGIEDEAQRNGYSLFLCNSDDDIEKEIKYIHLLRRHRIAGLIAVTIREDPDWTEALENLAAEGIPVAVFGYTRPSEQMIHIRVDDEAGFLKGTSHLFELGHERIGMILPPPDLAATSPRVSGFLKAYAQRGRKVPQELLAPGGWHMKDGWEAAGRLMNLKVPPTAIVAPNDMAAIGAITRIKEFNLRVPDDVAIVGYDNISIAEWYDPTITTVDQPHYKIGRESMKAVLRRIEDPTGPGESVEFETTLIVRRSSGGVPGTAQPQRLEDNPNEIILCRT